MSAARLGATGGNAGRAAPGGWAGRRWAVAAAIVAVALLAAWWTGLFRRRLDPRVVEIIAMQERAARQFASDGGPKTPEEAAAGVGAAVAIMLRMGQLPSDLREQAESAGRRLLAGRMRENIDRYFATPPGERRAELDRQIRQADLMRQAWESSNAAQSLAAGRAPGAGGQRDAGGWGPRGRTEEDRNRWRKELIDRTSPEQRARYAEYRRATESRREELGLPAGSRGPR